MVSFFLQREFPPRSKEAKNHLINEEVKIDKKKIGNSFLKKSWKKCRKLEKSIIKSGGGGKEVSEKRP